MLECFFNTDVFLIPDWSFSNPGNGEFDYFEPHREKTYLWGVQPYGLKPAYSAIEAS